MKRQDAPQTASDASVEESAPVSLSSEVVALIERVRADPADEDAWDELDETARSTQRPDRVSLLYRELLAREIAPTLVEPLGKRAVAFHDEWFEDPAFVIEILKRVLVLDAHAEWAFERLSLLLTMAERWDDLLAIYDAALAACDDREKKKTLLDEAARIAKDFAGSTDRAISYLKQLVPLRPEDAQLAQSLERRLLLQKRHRDLIDVWTARLSVMSPAEVLLTRVRIAETWLEKLTEAGTALDVVRQILATGGGEPQAARLLERIGMSASSPLETRRTALGLLKDRFAAADRSDDVIRAIILLLGVADEREERVALRSEASELLSRAGRFADAVDHAAEWLVLSPTREVKATLHALVEKAGKADRYAEALVRAAAATPEAAIRIEFLLDAGKTYDSLLGYPAAAIDLYSKVLADPSADDASLLDVARRLTGLLVGLDDRRARLDVLERRSVLEPDEDERRRHLGEAARLAEDLGDTDRALTLWQKRLTKDERDPEALDAIVAILDANRRWDALVGALGRRHDASTDPATRRADLVRIAAVQRAELEDLPAAIDTWHRIETEFGSGGETVNALADLSAAAERWSDVTALLRQAARQVEEPDLRAEHLGRMGDVYRTQRAAPLRAVEAYREALDVLPVHESSRAGLRELLDDAEAGALAAETLAKAYTDAGEWQGTLGLVERRVKRARDDAFRSEVLLEAASLLEHRASDKRAALRYVRAAFALLGDPAVETELVRLAEETDGWAACADGYADAIAISKNDDRRAELLFSHGAVLEKRLGDPVGALGSYEKVAELKPAALPAAVAVVRVGGLSGRWDVAARAFVRSAVARQSIGDEVESAFESTATSLAGWEPATVATAKAIADARSLTPSVAHDLKRKLAIWHRDHRDDPDAAEAALREASAEKVDRDTLRMLAELERRSPGRPLVGTLLRLAATLDDELDTLHEAATVALHAVGDPELSRPILERILDAASSRWKRATDAGAGTGEFAHHAQWAIDALAQLLLAANDPRAAAELLERGAALPFPGEASRRLRYRAAELVAERLGDAPRAVELCRGILAEAPDDRATLALLAGIFSRERRLDELLELRRRELELRPDVERRLFLRLDIAHVLGEVGGATSERVTALRDNLEDRPGHVPSIDALVEILEKENRHGELHSELVRQAEQSQQAGEASAAASLWARAGALAEQPLRDVDRALDAYRRSAALEPSARVFDALAAIHTARNEHGAATGWLEKRLERTGRGPGDVETYRVTVRKLARSYRAAGRPDDARSRLVDALEADPAATELRQYLAELYREGAEWPLLAPLLADGVAYASDAKDKVLLLRQAAQVHRRRLGALREAIPLLEQAVVFAPEDRSVRLALADALRSASRFDEARELLDAMLAEFGRRRTPERAAVHYHLARIAEAEGNLDQAHAQLESASSIERSDPKILKLLGDVARKRGELDAAERAYRALLLIVRRQQPPTLPADDADDEIVVASEVMFELHQMALEQGQSDRANDLLESAFETAAANNVEALRLERTLRAAGQTDLVLRVLDSRLERITDPAAAADILVARADLLAETGRLGEALDSLLGALEKTPGSVQLLSSAHDLAVRADAVERYMSRLAELAAAERERDALLASDLFMRLGAMAENELSEPTRAAGYYEESLSTGRRALRAYRAIVRVVSENDLERLARALREFVASSDQDETDATPRNEALYRLAEIDLTRPETVAEGAMILGQALDRAPDYDRALPLLANAVQGFPTDPALVRIYERVARAAGGDDVLLDALARASAFDDATVEQLSEATDLARRKNDPRLGMLLERLVAAARRRGSLRDVGPALVDLAALREASKDFAGAADLLEEAAGHGGPDAFDLGLRLAELASGSLGDLRRAAIVYERLRRDEPADARVWKPLLDVYRRLGAFPELEACIATTVEAVYDPAERNHLRMERGRILLEDPARHAEAETVLREVLDEDPDHVQASVVLAELLERAGRFPELNELLDRQLGAAKDRKDAAAVAALTLRIGKNLESTDRDAAVALYRESLEYAPADRALLEALLGLYGPDDDARDRVFVMERLLDVETGDAAVRLALELAAIAETEKDPVALERALRRGYEANPHSAGVRERLFEWYTKADDLEGLAGMLAIDARHREHPGEAVEQFREAARLWRDRLGNGGRAVELLAEAHDLVPGDLGLVEELATAALDAGRPAEALGVVTDALASGSVPPPGRARLLAQRARLRPKVQGYEIPVLDASIADLDQAMGLVDGGFESDLVDLLEAERLLSGEQDDVEVERRATMRLASLLPRAGDQRRGLELLVGWVKGHPNDAEAVRGLGQFAANAEKWSAASKAYARLVEITDGPDQIDAVVRLSDASERAGTPLEARAALEQVYARAPSDEMLRARLRRMYEAAGEYAELASIMIAEAEQASDDKVRFERLAEAGDLSLRVAGGERTAVEAFRRANALRPDEHHIIIKLADTLGALGEIEDAANILDQAIDGFGKRRSPELAELQHAMARVGRLAGDWEAVFAWLDAAVQTDRQNGAAASELAVIAMERGEHDIAIKALQAITLLKGEAPMSKAEAYLRQGIIAEQKGDAKKAVFLAKRALTQEPDFADAKAFLEKLGAA